MFARLRALFVTLSGLVLVLVSASVLASDNAGVSSFRFRAEPVTLLPESKPLDVAKLALGQALFFDRRLSDDGQQSCGDCHQLPALNPGLGLDTVIEFQSWGPNKRDLNLLYNVSYYRWFNWDGRYQSLETLIDKSITDLNKFNTTWTELLSRLGTSYQAQAQSLYDQELSKAIVIEALAYFVRSLRTEPSAFDRYLQGHQQALSLEQQRGYQLFKQVGCSSCHHGRMLGGNLFEEFYLYRHEGEEDDETWLDDQGRYYLTGEEHDRNTFRVSTLRNVAVTAPYFHDGSAKTLKDAVDEMAEHQLGVRLSERELELLVGFLISLTGSHNGYSAEQVAR